METLSDVKAFIEWIPTLGVTGILALLAFPKTRNWLGFGNGHGVEPTAVALHTEQIKALERHAEIANDEMGEIRGDIKDMKEDLGFIKGKVSNL